MLVRFTKEEGGVGGGGADSDAAASLCFAGLGGTTISNGCTVTTSSLKSAWSDSGTRLKLMSSSSDDNEF